MMMIVIVFRCVHRTRHFCSTVLIIYFIPMISILFIEILFSRNEISIFFKKNYFYSIVFNHVFKSDKFLFPL